MKGRLACFIAAAFLRFPVYPRSTAPLAPPDADRRGATLRRKRLVGWELEPGTGLHYDPTTDRLLAAMRRLGPPERPPEPARPVLIEATPAWNCGP